MNEKIKKTLINENNQVLKVIDEMNLGEGSIFIDIGAQHGQEIFHLAKRNIITISFECHPGHMRSLQKNFGSYKNVFLYHAAICTKNEEVEVFFKNGNWGDSTWEYDEKGNYVVTNMKDKTSPNYYPGGSMTMQKDKYGIILEMVNDLGQVSSAGMKIHGIDIASLIVEISDLYKRKIDVVKIDTEGTEYELINRIIETNTVDLVERVYYEDHERKIWEGAPREKWCEFKSQTLEKMKSYQDKFFVWY